MDLYGPMQTQLMGGSRYFLLFINDHTLMNWVYFLKCKSDAFKYLKSFQSLVERQAGVKLKTLRTDRGGEFMSNEFMAYCESQGIRRQYTAPHSPQQNGVVERRNRTLVERARSILKAKMLPNSFWAEAVATAAYLSNISPTRAVLGRTPYEAWHQRKPTVSHLRIFGSIAYYHILSNSRQKLDARAQKGIFVGYCSESKAYKIYNPLTDKMITSRDVTFNKGSQWDWDIGGRSTHSITIEGSNGNEDSSGMNIEQGVTEAAGNATHGNDVIHGSGVVETEGELGEHAIAPTDDTPPRRVRTLQDVYERCSFALNVADPFTFEEAYKHPEWREAMN